MKRLYIKRNNNLILKIDEIRYIAKYTKAALNGIAKSNFDKSQGSKKITTIYFLAIKTETVDVLRDI